VQIGRLLFQKRQWDVRFAADAARLEPVSISRAAPFGGSQTLHDVNSLAQGTLCPCCHVKTRAEVGATSYFLEKPVSMHRNINAGIHRASI
jgi:hypothetical protein